MLKRPYRCLVDALETKASPYGLAVFRMLYSAVLFFEVTQLFRFRHLVYDKIPFVDPSEINWSWPLAIWMICIAFVGFGACYRIGTILNYVIGLVCIGTLSSYEYHMHYVYMGVNFLLMFVPTASVLSVDSLMGRMLAARQRKPYVQPEVSILGYRIILFIGVALVYFDSIFHKLGGSIWTGGLGAWLPANLPMITRFDSASLVDRQWLALGAGYTTVVFEAVFIFVFWNKRFAWPLIAVGLGLHIGILFEFPIPFFALGVSSMYLLLIPTKAWDKLVGFLHRAATQTLTVFYDGECPLCRQTQALLCAFDWRGRTSWRTVQSLGSDELPANVERQRLLTGMYSLDTAGNVFEGVDSYREIFNRIWFLRPASILMRLWPINKLCKKVYVAIAVHRTRTPCTDDECALELPTGRAVSVAMPLGARFSTRTRALVITCFLVTVLFTQLLMIVRAPLVQQTAARLGVNDSFPMWAMEKASGIAERFSRPALGITPHPVFMDFHFDGYNHQIKVVHRESNKTIPVCDANGVPCGPGFLWVKWTWRVMGPHVDQAKFTRGLRDFSAFWLVENGYSAEDEVTFDVYCRRVMVPSEWRENLYLDQLKKPWEIIGECKWESNKFTSDVKPVEGH